MGRIARKQPDGNRLDRLLYRRGYPFGAPFPKQGRHLRPIDSLRFAELNEHTAPAEVSALFAPLLTGTDAGVLSEAGLPGVADPGADAVALAHIHGIEVVPLVGPSSILLALMASGLNGQSFAFNGYLPIRQPRPQQSYPPFRGPGAKRTPIADFHRSTVPQPETVRRFLYRLPSADTPDHSGRSVATRSTDPYPDHRTMA